MLKSSKELKIIGLINYEWYNFPTSEFTSGISTGADAKIFPAYSLRLVVHLSIASNPSSHPVSEINNATKSESRGQKHQLEHPKKVFPFIHSERTTMSVDW
jgi:hypothetical protein